LIAYEKVVRGVLSWPDIIAGEMSLRVLDATVIVMCKIVMDLAYGVAENLRLCYPHLFCSIFREVKLILEKRDIFNRLAVCDIAFEMIENEPPRSRAARYLR